MSTAESGNGSLQNYRRDSGKKVRGSNFFESLKSKRRLDNLASMNQLMKAYLSDHVTDELGEIEELEGCRVRPIPRRATHVRVAGR